RGPAAAAESCSAQCLGRTRARPPSPPAHGRGLAAPVRAPGSGSAAAAPPARTLIIFDWDDTLLCSSALNEGECTPEALRELARAVEAVLHTAMGLGDTVIVTNARESWVEESVRRFMCWPGPSAASRSCRPAPATSGASPGSPPSGRRRRSRRLAR
ncbi:unnamed protein product, partial [Prorocentrum cordatum]